MTASTRHPHWSDDDQWTEFFLLIAPTVRLTVSARGLYYRARRAIRADTILGDLVTIGLACVIDGSVEQDEAVLAALIAGATAQGHLLAPRAVFGCLVVGADGAPVESAVRRLARHPLARALRVRFAGQVLAAERRRDVCLGGPDDVADEESPPLLESVAGIVDFAGYLMRAYEQEPLIATGESEFLTVLAESRVEQPLVPVRQFRRDVH